VPVADQYRFRSRTAPGAAMDDPQRREPGRCDPGKSFAMWDTRFFRSLFRGVSTGVHEINPGGKNRPKRAFDALSSR
jgi:hypothetical protein